MGQGPKRNSAIIMPMQPLIVGIRFVDIGKAYHFDATSVPQIKVGDRVIVETSRGKQLGEVVQIVKSPSPTPEGWKPIERIATARSRSAPNLGSKGSRGNGYLPGSALHN